MKKNHITIGIVYLLHLLFSGGLCLAQEWNHGLYTFFQLPFYLIYLATFPLATAVAAVLDMILCLIFRKGWKLSLATGAIGIFLLWLYFWPSVTSALKHDSVYVFAGSTLVILTCWLIRWMRIKKAAT